MAFRGHIRKAPPHWENTVQRMSQRACTQKGAYVTLEEAESAPPAKMFGLFPYLCPFASHWHLTHMQHGYERASNTR